MILVSCSKEQAADVGCVDDDTVCQDTLSSVMIVKFGKDVSSLIAGDIKQGKVITKSLDLNCLVDGLGILSIRREFPDAGRFEGRTEESGLDRWYRITYSPDIPKVKASDAFSSMSGVEYVGTKMKIKVAGSYFNDPFYSYQWPLSGFSKSGDSSCAGVDVIPAWKYFTTGSEDVIVAVVDGGLDMNHEDLSENCIPGGNDGSWNFVRGYAGSLIFPHDHGTHVGGIIAAVNNNGKGVCGVAGGDYSSGKKGVRLLSCQIFMKNPDGIKDLTGDEAAAIKWGADHGAVLSNNSWEYDYSSEADAENNETPLYLKEAIDYFVKYAGYDENGVQTGPMAGGLVFFAAGNDNRSCSHPADYENVIAVGSVSSDFKRASYSNYGDWVDISAPGGDLTGSYANVLSTYADNKYGYMAGTSMSCPIVTGIAALLVSYYGRKGFTNAELKEKLIGGADAILPQGSDIGPLADAMGACTYNCLKAPDPVSSFSVSSQANRLDFSFDVTCGMDGGKSYGYLLVAGKDKNDVENFDPSLQYPSGIHYTKLLTDTLKVGKQITGSISGLDFSSGYYAAVFAYNYHGKYSGISPVKAVSTGKYHSPVIVPLVNGIYTVKSNESLSFDYYVSDPDGHSITVSVSAGPAVTSEYDGENLKITINGRKAGLGTYSGVITATDQYSASTDLAFDYKVVQDQPPVVAEDVNDMIVYGLDHTFSMDMSDLFSDPDDSVLIYKVRNYDSNVTDVAVTDNLVSCSVCSYGLSEFVMEASDNSGKSCQLSFSVLVKNPDNLAEAYPNPVSSTLYIRTEKEAPTHIKIVSISGVIIYDKTLQVSGFSPAEIDMSECVPGVYGLYISYSDKVFKKTIVKK